LNAPPLQTKDLVLKFSPLEYNSLSTQISHTLPVMFLNPQELGIPILFGVGLFVWENRLNNMFSIE
jgi:hypothetical protein